MSHRALLALGSNLGDRWANLGGAVAGLPDVVAVSRVYETAPVGGPDQGPYLNCVVRLETDLDARALLDASTEGVSSMNFCRKVSKGRSPATRRI